MSRLVLSSESLFERIYEEDDASRRLKWMKKHRGQKENIYAFDSYDSSKGWGLKPNIRDMAVFGNKILKRQAYYSKQPVIGMQRGT
jgi:hypothetical protein